VCNSNELENYYSIQKMKMQRKKKQKRSAYILFAMTLGDPPNRINQPAREKIAGGILRNGLTFFPPMEYSIRQPPTPQRRCHALPPITAASGPAWLFHAGRVGRRR
jgi:hypothetical protein